MKPVAYPYPVLPASALPDPEWFLASGDDLTSLRDGIDAWDAELPLDLHASLAAWPAFDDLFQSSGLGEAFQHHWIPSTPGPGSSTYHRVSCGMQPLSPNRSAAAFSFGRSDRFAWGDIIQGKRATPGPGTYVA